MSTLAAASRSKPGAVHYLEMTPAGVRCSCPGFTYRGRCAHVDNLPSTQEAPRVSDQTNALAARSPNGAAAELGAIERVIAMGDLSKMTPDDRTRYYLEVCRSLGLNPLTKPFEYLTLNGKLLLYARKDCTDQLRSLRRVSLQIVSRETVGELYVVTARAVLPDGRTDEEIGAVSIKGLMGEALANALMKASTKAKRRVTLSVCGLGMLDESETESIPGAAVHVETHRPQQREQVAIAAPVATDDRPDVPLFDEDDEPARPPPPSIPFQAPATGDLATPAQVKAIYAIARGNGTDADEVADQQFGTTPERLTRRQASALIDRLKGQ